MLLLKLIKWRLSLAVAFSAAAGFFIYAGSFSFDALLSFAGVFLMSGGAAGLNQLQEKHLDKLMSRTSARPLPTQNLGVVQAGLFIALCFLSGSLLLAKLGWIPLALSCTNVFFYNGLYTPLKRRTSFAILPGGIVGALPPMIGWSSAGGSLDQPQILFLATLMFLWQIPHFWLLVIKHGKDYEKAGFKSISSNLDHKQIRNLVFYWMVISSVFLSSFFLFGIKIETVLTVILLILNLIFISSFYWFLFKVKDLNKIKPAFVLTNVFLVIVLLLFILDSLLF